MMPTSELLFSAVALLGVALSSAALLSCKSDEVSAEPRPAAILRNAGERSATTATAAALDASDPEALRRAAAVVAMWNQKDPALTAKVLKDNGIVITDPATFQAMADAQAAASAAASAASVASAAPRTKPPAAAPQRPASASQISSPMA